MKANIASGKKRRWYRLGPVTILALIAAVGILFAGRFAKSPLPDPNVGRIVFEADAKGHLRRLDAPSGLLHTALPLWKPVPGFLLEHAQELNLNSRQRKEIERMNSAWLSEKALLEQRISYAASDANTHLHISDSSQNVSALKVTDSLKDYSRLSREYDERRADSWRRSLALLTTKQQESLNRIKARIGHY